MQSLGGRISKYNVIALSRVAIQRRLPGSRVGGEGEGGFIKDDMLNAFFAKRKQKIEVEEMDSRKEEEEVKSKGRCCYI